jgi:hypothetical protein
MSVVTASGGMCGSPRRLGGWVLQIAVPPAFLVVEAAKLDCVMNS